MPVFGLVHDEIVIGVIVRLRGISVLINDSMDSRMKSREGQSHGACHPKEAENPRRPKRLVKAWTRADRRSQPTGQNHQLNLNLRTTGHPRIYCRSLTLKLDAHGPYHPSRMLFPLDFS
jgi:hypothetical protein